MSTINNKLLEALKRISNCNDLATAREYAREAIAEAEQQEDTDFEKAYNTACSKIDELNEELAILKEKKETTGSGCYSGGIISTGEEL